MSLTTITITGTYETPAGRPAEGQITATLSEPIQNATILIDPTPITGQITNGQVKDNTGVLPFTLLATNDPGTTPTGAVYEFVIELDDAPLEQFNAAIPYNAVAGTVDLSTIS